MPESGFCRPVIFAWIAVAASGAVLPQTVQAAESAPTFKIAGMVHQTEILLAPEIQGRMGALNVRAGATIRTGEVLAVLSNPDLTAAFSQAQADANSVRASRANVLAGVRSEELEIAKQNVSIASSNYVLAQQQFARQERLAASNFASKQDLDESTAALMLAKAGVASAMASYAESKAGPTKEQRRIADAQFAAARASVVDSEAKLDKTKLISPVDGVVGKLIAEVGEIISPGQTVMTLEPHGDKFFGFTVREDELGGIAIGARIALESDKGLVPALVTQLTPLGDYATWQAARAVGDHDLNSFFVRADPVGAANALEPGMTVWLSARASGT